MDPDGKGRRDGKDPGDGKDRLIAKVRDCFGYMGPRANGGEAWFPDGWWIKGRKGSDHPMALKVGEIAAALHCLARYYATGSEKRSERCRELSDPNSGPLRIRAMEAMPDVDNVIRQAKLTLTSGSYGEWRTLILGEFPVDSAENTQSTELACLINKQTLEALEIGQECDVGNKLDSLVGRGYTTTEKLSEQVRKLLSDDEFGRHWPNIVKQAQETALDDKLGAALKYLADDPWLNSFVEAHRAIEAAIRADRPLGERLLQTIAAQLTAELTSCFHGHEIIAPERKSDITKWFAGTELVKHYLGLDIELDAEFMATHVIAILWQIVQKYPPQQKHAEPELSRMGFSMRRLTVPEQFPERLVPMIVASGAPTRGYTWIEEVVTMWYFG